MTNISWNITDLKISSNLPGTNELKPQKKN